MSIENVKKLELGMDMSCNCEKYLPEGIEITREMMQPFINKGMQLEKEAFETKDIDVLNRAFDYFFEEQNDDALMCGGCETLENEIFYYFSMDQILEVLDKKFEKLVETNIDRAVKILSGFVNEGYIEDIRKIFFEMKSRDLKIKILDEFDDWCEGDDWYEGYNFIEERTLLRKDLQR